MRQRTLLTLAIALCLAACGQKGKAGALAGTNGDSAAVAAEASVADSMADGDILVQGDPSDPYQALVGTQFRDFSMNDMDGVQRSLSDFVGQPVKGKKHYVLVDFWASWCRPCMMEMPNVKRNWQQFKAQGFEVVGVSLDGDPMAWRMAAKNNGYSWVQLCDFKGFDSPAVRLYSLQYIPWNILCNDKGVIVAVNLRGEALGTVLEQLYK